MQRIGIVYRENPPAAVAMAVRLERLIGASGLDVKSRMVERDHDLPDHMMGCDFIIVLGGDGTIISTARQVAALGTPILGVNYGHVGFLTELDPDTIEHELPAYLHGDYWVDQRAMLSGSLVVNGTTETFLALNDVIVARGPEPRVIRFTIRIDDADFTTLTADGIIVATATGSTAYNLAAGGPILFPSVQSMVVTPIAPHLALERPLVLEPHTKVQIELAASSGAAVLAADGQLIWPFDGAAIVTVTISPHITRFLRRRSRNHFYQVLNQKLQEH